MFERQGSGSVVCPSCGRLVGVKDKVCAHCGRPFPGMFGFSRFLTGLGHDMGFVQFVTGGCVLLFLAALAIDSGQGFSGSFFRILSPGPKGQFLLGASGSVPVFVLDRWWTVLSASWLHGGLLHIFFNLMWVRQLGSLTAEVYGAGRMMIIYTVASVTGFLLTSSVAYFLPNLPGFLGGANFSLGASASLFGLLGGLIYFGQRGGSASLNTQVKSWALALFLFGFVFPGVDNWAHLGGFLGGYVAGRVMDPLKPERNDHLIGGLVCVLLFVASLVLSLVHGYSILPELERAGWF